MPNGATDPVDLPLPAPPLPTFLIIGAQKGATRWLRANLGEHPDVYAVPDELSFFNIPLTFRELGVAGYRQQFAGWAGEPLVGESTPGYMMLRHDPAVVAKRMQRIIPDVRLLAVLRNPVDRANSAMVHHIVRHRLPSDTDLVHFLRENPAEAASLELVAGGWYAASLRPFLERFGEQLHVLLFDDLVRDPSSFYAEAVAHIGATRGFVPTELAEQVRSNQIEREQLEGLDRAVEIAWQAKRRLSGAAPNRRGVRSIAPEVRAEVYELFRHDVDDLEVLLDRDLSIWDPERADDAPEGAASRSSEMAAELHSEPQP